jgi:hypothetical protein
MAMSPRQIIEAICPELSGSPSLPVYLEMAVEVTDKGFFGSLYNYAIAYRAAHLFTVMGDSNGGGGSGNSGIGTNPIASMSEGSMSVSFAVQAQAAGADSLANTKYGKMLEDLINTRPTANVAGPGCLPGGYR